MVPDPEPPGSICPLRCVVDADTRPAGDLRGTDPPGSFLDPDAIAEEIGAIECPIDAERDAELARPARQVAVRSSVPPRSHTRDSLDGLERSNQHGVGDAPGIRDHVELVIHAVDE